MSSITAAGAPPPARKRRRPALACEQCRNRKVKCDRTLPCKNCTRAHRADECSYQPDERVTLPQRTRPGVSRDSSAEHDAAADALWSLGGTSDPSTHSHVKPVTSRWSTSDMRPSPSQSQPSDVDGLTQRVRQLEDQLNSVLGGKGATAGSTPKSTGPGESFESESFTRPGSQLAIKLSKGTVSKTRYFGLSHWSNGTSLFPMLYNLVTRNEMDPHLSNIFGQCKRLGRTIKAARNPSLPLPANNPIPISRELADALVEAYLRSFETVHRVLHIPTFLGDYARYWTNPPSASLMFTTQLQLVMAIGACFHDDRFELRGLASRWVHAAQLWMLTPPEKGKMNIPGLQIMCLLHLAREVCALGADLVWVSAGSLLRTAMYMGFHRDPSHLPGISPFLSEIRRRLWVTVLELALQSSLDSGGPPLVNVENWDTLPPGNFDDEQLTEMMGHSSHGGDAALPRPKPLTAFTQTSVALALHKSFPVRLAIATIVNDFRTELSYHKTLQLNSELSSACRGLTAILASYGPDNGDGRTGPSGFQTRLVEQMSQRFFLVLNQVWLREAQTDARYYFARKVLVETSLQLMKRLDFSSENPHQHEELETQGHVDFRRLTTNGAGGFRSVFIVCMAALGVELLSQLEDDRAVRASLGIYPSPTASASSPHLSSSVPSNPSLSISSIASQEALMAALMPLGRWTEMRIRSGETNIKGHVFLNCIKAQAEGLKRGEEDAAIEMSLLVAVRERAELALQFLEEVAAQPPFFGETGGQPLGIDNGEIGGLHMGMGAAGSFADVDPYAPLPPDQGDWGWEDLMQDEIDPGFSFGMLGTVFNGF